MTFKVLAWTAVTVLSMSQASFTHEHTELCDGFVEKNSMNIPTSFTMTGIDKTEFDKVLDIIEGIYAPIISAKGGTLEMKRNWDDGTVNAYAQRMGTKYIVQMFGGLARHPAVTSDAFALVACHEVGHHLAGAPKVANPWSKWASNEGQSDYFAGLKCLRKYYALTDNTEWMTKNSAAIPAFVSDTCTATFSDAQEQINCLRTSMAGLSVGLLFKDLRKEDTLPDFQTPDKNVVTRTSDKHPATQCRLDTYFQSALCTVAVSDEVSDSDYKTGTCTPEAGFSLGLRPLCWFAPPTAAQ